MQLINHINIYEDASVTNNPAKNNVRWTNTIEGIEVSEPESRSLRVAGKQTETLFSGVVPTSIDGTTTFDLTIKPSVSGTYVLKHNAGTQPNFRTKRNLATDATSQVTITKSGALLTFTASGGTLFSTAALVFGDSVRIGPAFSVYNQGLYKILSFTSTSFTIENIAGVVQNVTLGATFDDEIRAFSANGVQIGDKVKITANFSGYSQDVYEITDVDPEYLEIHTNKSIPEESNVQAQVVVYSTSKTFFYIECDKPCTLFIDGVNQGQIKPFFFGTKQRSGVFMRTGSMYSAEIRNDSVDLANVLIISAE